MYDIRQLQLAAGDSPNWFLIVLFAVWIIAAICEWIDKEMKKAKAQDEHRMRAAAYEGYRRGFRDAHADESDEESDDDGEVSDDDDDDESDEDDDSEDDDDNCEDDSDSEDVDDEDLLEHGRQRDLELLGLSTSATWSDVQAVYRELAKQVHPDTLESSNVSPRVRGLATQYFKKITGAYQRLRDEMREE